MENIKEGYNRLLKSKEFKEQGFLCGIFMMSEIKDIENENWEIDFYDKKSDRIRSYLIMGGEIKKLPKDKVFTESTESIEELDLDDVKIEFKEAIKKGEEVLKEKNEEATKIIIILQKQGITNWNISYITKKFNILNIKIDARNGKIIKEELVSLLSFRQR